VTVAVLLGALSVTTYLLLKESHAAKTSIAQPRNPAPSPYLKTSWGTSCKVTAEQVVCQTCVPGQVITNAYTCTDPAPEVAVNASGLVVRNPKDIGASSDPQRLADGKTYHVSGWTIVVSGGWARFINDTTGHGMAVAPQNFDSF
jgi:hypothetical protein